MIEFVLSQWQGILATLFVVTGVIVFLFKWGWLRRAPAAHPAAAPPPAPGAAPAANKGFWVTTGKALRNVMIYWWGFLATAIATLVALLIIGLLLMIGSCTYAVATVAGRLEEAAAAPTTVVAPADPLTELEQNTVRHLFIAEAVDRYGWTESPRESTVVVDRSRPYERRYGVNLVYMKELENEVTDGDIGVYHVMQEGLRGDADPFVRPGNPHAQGLTVEGMNGEATYPLHTLFLRPQDESGTKAEIKYTLVPPTDGSVVIQTEAIIPAGFGKLWGTVPTELDGRLLSWEMKVVIFDRHKQAVPVDHFTANPPVVAFGTRATRPFSYVKSDAGYCYSAVTLFKSKPGALRRGNVLYIEIPEHFGDAFVRVNFKIN